MAEPSKVLHIRNVGPEITEHHLLQLAQAFGVPQKIVMLRAKNQELQPNRILLITIHNLLYPITVDVLHQVFSPHGFVEKVVTFQKSAGLQALLQFRSEQSAMHARSTLQGCNIYDACCTLDIQFSKLQELQVNFNNERTRDYTNVTLPSEQTRQGNPANTNIMLSLLGEGGNHYNMLQAAAPRPGFRQQAGGSPQLGMNSYQAQFGGASAAASVFGGVLPPGNNWHK